MFEKYIERQFRISLFEKDKNPRISFSKLKYSYNYKLACIVVDSIKTSNVFDKWIYGEALPKDISLIGETSILFNNNKLEDEINWIILSVRKFNSEINKFIDYKNKFETFVLIGDYKKAEDILDIIDVEISCSLWSIENRFLLIELRKGLKENTGYLNDINTKNKQSYIRYLSHFYSNKAEKELSVNRYEVNLLKFSLPLVEKGFNADLDYYFFKLNPLLKSHYDHLSEILAFENYNSIIDKYITLIQILKLCIANYAENDHNLNEFIENRLFYLGKKVNDPQIRILKSIITDKYEGLNLNTFDYELISIIDLYTEGNYNDCQKKIENILSQNPLISNLYELYVKCLIQQKKSLSFGNKDSFLFQILSALFDLYGKDKSAVDSGIVLKKIAYNLSSISSVSYYLINIVKSEIDNDNSFDKLAMINSQFLNPLLYKIHFNSINYLDFLSKCVKSTTVDLFSTIVKDKITNIDHISNVHIERFKFYKALNYQNNEDYLNANIIWESLLKDEVIGFSLEKILINHFYCKAKQGDYDSCIDLYVAYNFKNQNLIQQINVQIVKDEIKKNRYKNVLHTIQLPLFFYLTNSEAYDIHTAYECYLLENDCEKASDLIEKLDLNDEYGVCFLSKVCNLEIFKHSPFITSTKEKFSERIKLCKYLSKIDLANKELYKEEEVLLSNRLIIQKGLQEIDESKIYVNQDSIILNELKDLKSTFNRFVSIAELSTEKGITFINLGSERMYNVSLQEEKDMNIEFSKDPQYDIFKEMFYEIRNKFLYSKYGLKLNLSTRIRHGVLEGEIRSEFLILNLITEKENASIIYKDNKYWIEKLKNYNEDDEIKTFKVLSSDFALKVDSLIYDEILSKYLLIKTEKENPEGWLDYKYDEFDLQFLYSIIYKKITEYPDFISSIFEELWHRTEKNLIEIKNKITNEYRDKFFDIIHLYEKSLQISTINVPDELMTNLTQIKTRVENKLSKIAGWFTITDSQISDFEINKIIEVCCESLQNHYTTKKLVLNKNIDCENIFNGKYFTQLVYLIRIFFQNIFDYSDGESVVIDLNISNNDNFLTIKIQNNLKENEDIEILKKKVDIKYDIKKSQSDKSSGLYKALNIVQTSFDNDNNELAINIVENKFCVIVKLNLTEILA